MTFPYSSENVTRRSCPLSVTEHDSVFEELPAFTVMSTFPSLSGFTSTSNPTAGSTYITDGSLTVHVREPAVEGRATEAVLRVLADHLGVAKSRITLVAGATSRIKRFRVDHDM